MHLIKILQIKTFISSQLDLLLIVLLKEPKFHALLMDKQVQEKLSQ
jgi:hypothetical protein